MTAKKYYEVTLYQLRNNDTGQADIIATSREEFNRALDDKIKEYAEQYGTDRGFEDWYTIEEDYITEDEVMAWVYQIEEQKHKLGVKDETQKAI